MSRLVRRLRPMAREPGLLGEAADRGRFEQQLTDTWQTALASSKTAEARTRKRALISALVRANSAVATKGQVVARDLPPLGGSGGRPSLRISHNSRP